MSRETYQDHSRSIPGNTQRSTTTNISQISYSLVVILELNSVPEVQYKDVMMTDNEKYQQE